MTELLTEADKIWREKYLERMWNYRKNKVRKTKFAKQFKNLLLVTGYLVK